MRASVERERQETWGDKEDMHQRYSAGSKTVGAAVMWHVPKTQGNQYV